MSAYLDKRGLWAAGKPARHPTYTIVIVSVAPKLYSGKEGLSCAVKGAADDPLLVDARLTAHPGDAVHRHPYTTVTIECDVKPASLSGNLYVTVDIRCTSLPNSYAVHIDLFRSQPRQRRKD